MEDIHDKYEYLEAISEGTFGAVHLALRKRDRAKVVIKRLKRVHDSSCGLPRSVLREIALLFDLRDHPSVVRIEEVVQQRQYQSIYLVLQHCQCGTLQQLLMARPLTLFETRSITRQLISVVAHLHLNSIIHRDIKPANILLRALHPLPQIKLCDFGSARLMLDEDPLTDNVTTPYYRSSEAYLGGSYGPASDLWSVGCILFQCLTGQKFIQGQTQVNLLDNIFANLGSPKQILGLPLMKRASLVLTKEYRKPVLASRLKGVDSQAVDLLSVLLVLQPSKRIRAQQALRMPFLRAV